MTEATTTKRKLRSDKNEKYAKSVIDDAVAVEDGDIDVEEAEDDDSPVGISWKESKDVFNKIEKQRMEAVEFVRSKDKEKRRKKNEMFVAQKRTKTSKMTLTKLPDDILQAVAKEVKEPRVDESNNPKKVSKKVKQKEKSSTKTKKKDKTQDPKPSEYYNVLVVQDEVNKPKKVQESAAAFMENHLYGDRLQRTSATSNLTLQSKSFGFMKPALKFNS